jgi:predicted glycosyltransferase
MKTVVSYAVNGGGVGHVMRLLAINRWLRHLAQTRGKNIQQLFITNSEAPSLIAREGFECIKVLSHGRARRVGISERRIIDTSAATVRSMIKSLSPHLLINDTFPCGAYGELPSVRKMCADAALIYRPIKESKSSKYFFQRGLGMYNKILIPEYSSDVNLNIPPELCERASFVGPVMIREHDQVPMRTAVRELLNISNSQTAVYVSAGGGGDKAASRAISTILDSLARYTSVVAIVGSGPLFKENLRPSPSVRYLFGSPSAEILNGMDLAITSCGYNTFSELMFFGVPSILYAQSRRSDDQRLRAMTAEANGAAIYIPNLYKVGQLETALLKVMNPLIRQTLHRRSRMLIPRNHAKDFAEIFYNMLWPKTHKATSL